MKKPVPGLLIYSTIATLSGIAMMFWMLGSGAPYGLVLILSIMMFGGVFLALVCPYTFNGSKDEIRKLRTNTILFILMTLAIGYMVFSCRTSRVQNPQIDWPQKN